MAGSTETNSAYPITWDLASLLPAPASDEFRRILTQFRAELTALAADSETIPAPSGAPDSVASWSDQLRRYERLYAEAHDLRSFVECWSAADAENPLYMQLLGELAALEPLREQIETNFELALKATGDGDLTGLIEADSWLGEIEFYLRWLRRHAAHRLPKDQELLAADLAVDGFHAWGRLYDRLSGALRIRVMERGVVVEKSPGQVQFDSPQQAVRENNFYAAGAAWNTIADTCADALNHIAGTRLVKYRRLGLKDHLDSPLLHNRMTRETLEAMWDAVSARKAMLVPYLERKAALLGQPALNWYDLQAPLPQASPPGGQTKLAYDDACWTIVGAFGEFSGEFGEFAQHALRNAWVEAENRGGKGQGGFCTSFPTARESRIFMTYVDTPDSMSTLAHELGHAYHSHVLREQPVYLRSYPMNLAETASTFAEAILGEKRLEAAQSDGERLALLDGMLSDSVAFLMNIHARFLFEHNFHVERGRGEVSAGRLSELMLSAQKEAYRDALDDDGWYPGFWISKLHFYITELPFYNFPYTFGYLLSLGLYAAGRDGGAEFPEKYRRLLLATGCQETEAAVASTLGFDLREKSFWNRSLDVVEQRVEQFLRLEV